MKVGDLVKLVPYVYNRNGAHLSQDCIGIIIDFHKGIVPVVYWNDRFPRQFETWSGIEVVNESR